MITGWKAETSAKNKLYVRVRESILPKYRDCDMCSLYSAKPKAQLSTLQEKTFPTLTPLPVENDTHTMRIEGCFVDIAYLVNANKVDLQCTRRVPEGSTHPSGVYRVDYFLPRPSREDKAISCAPVDGQIALWEVKVCYLVPFPATF